MEGGLESGTGPDWRQGDTSESLRTGACKVLDRTSQSGTSAGKMIYPSIQFMVPRLAGRDIDVLLPSWACSLGKGTQIKTHAIHGRLAIEHVGSRAKLDP